MATQREQLQAELRRSIDVLPERTRRAMLVGIKNNTVITGAFAGGDGVCPMLAAHRAGGRTSCVSFPEAWDKFTGVYGRRIIRKATEYEVQILCEEIEASLQPQPSLLREAVVDYQSSVEARQEHEALAAQEALVEQEEHVEDEAPAEPRRRRLRVTGGLYVDFGEVIAEHMAMARNRRGREAEDVGLGWLFEETLVLPEDFGSETAPEHPAAEEFDFDDADAQLSR